MVDEPKEEVENVTHDGLRAQKSPPSGMRPGSLLDPGPQRSDHTVRHSAGSAPLLVVPALRGDEGVEEKERDRKRRKEHADATIELRSLFAVPKK